MEYLAGVSCLHNVSLFDIYRPELEQQVLAILLLSFTNVNR